MALPKYYAHPEPDTLVPLLQSQLPRSGPLLRRIQHDIVRKSPTACYLATFSPAARPSAAFEPPTPWLVAYVDLYVWPETQVWVYSSLEAEGTTSCGDRSTFKSSDFHLNQARMQVIGLISHCFEELFPRFLASSGVLDSSTTGRYKDQLRSPPPNPPTTLLLGTVHSGVVKLLRDAMTLSGPLPYPRYHLPYADDCMKYSFCRLSYDPACNHTPLILPPGYRCRSLNGLEGFQPYQYGLVRSRTYIARSKTALQNMASVVLYYDGPEDSKQETNGDEGNQETKDAQEMPIAWTFLGYDASLLSLYVEPEHRGRGLAAFLAKSVMQRGMLEKGQFSLAMEHEKEDGWAFADVALDNHASRRVMEKMGGEPAWTAAWIVAQPCRGEQCASCTGNGTSG
ncbi:hypothetical protein PRK78_003603 [Emydomyces testavorans]|uniref:GCN5-related N-acetyltransferase Rv2170-like domain-containing protein n=1 Tax=Emydomyces testavorans TaxID=2070801 RepID=A0AAF0IIX9_9EURO|nr:hypothetical protein PRK78_003603 [Emydomyces testavorans]